MSRGDKAGPFGAEAPLAPSPASSCPPPGAGGPVKHSEGRCFSGVTCCLFSDLKLEFMCEPNPAPSSLYQGHLACRAIKPLPRDVGGQTALSAGPRRGQMSQQGQLLDSPRDRSESLT